MLMAFKGGFCFEIVFNFHIYPTYPVMERFMIPFVAQESLRPLHRPPWKRSAVELIGRISTRYKHESCQLLLDLYAEVSSFGNIYNTQCDCPTHIARGVSAANQNRPNTFIREGITGLQFDSKVCCISRHHNVVLLYDIGYVSSKPIEVLETRKPRFSQQELHNGLSDVVFASADKSRLLASGLDGAIYIWDRRVSNLPFVSLSSSSQSPINSIQLDVEDRVVFGASKQGIIHAWDLRGGRASFAFQSHNEVHHPLLTSLKVSSLLEKISPLKAQSKILPSEIHSINLDPSCSYQLAFHLDDGWSGVLNLNNLNVTHVHCPPPPWLDGSDEPIPQYLRRPAWLPSCSVYAVGSSSGSGVYLLDFFPDKTSACYVDFSDALQSVTDESKGVQFIQNRYIPVSERVLVCAAHPQNGTIIAGSKRSGLLMISQRNQTNETSRHESS
ncbi:hypothetical protein HPP92_018945 [Vanilla planifolia]|uniref:Transducin/WD40 repeat-like superfamily protein n=1 Tax=Vanilla planifolia TaxID=51239 RepID=A0A835UNV1_VANPL|nr:hypothetical protein HPP92_018945 [Vanilla planifolia]